MQIPNGFGALPFFVLAACGGGSDLPSSRPGDLATPAAGAEAADIRTALEDGCTGAEIDLALEGFAIVAETARFSELSAAERSALEEREAAYAAERGTFSPSCQAEIDKIV